MRPVTYAVLWSVNDGPELAGAVALAGSGLELSGSAAGGPRVRQVFPYTDLRELYFERLAPRKHTWDPSLVLVTSSGDRVAIGSLQGLGALHELADEVAGHREHSAA